MCRPVGVKPHPVLDQPRTVTLMLALTSNLNRILSAIAESSRITNISELLRRLIVLAESPALRKSVDSETSRLVMAYA